MKVTITKVTPCGFNLKTHDRLLNVQVTIEESVVSGQHGYIIADNKDFVNNLREATLKSENKKKEEMARRGEFDDIVGTVFKW